MVGGGLGAVAFGDGVGPVALDGFQLRAGAGQLLLEAGVLALQLVDPALGVAASRLELLAPRAPGPGGAEGEEQEQAHQEAEAGGQDQQLTLAELAERPVEEGGRARVGVLEAGRADHHDEQECEEKEEDGHSMPPQDRSSGIEHPTS